ncbi:hypothetical protein ACTFIZ_009428 [Dictyostelium cf. discoideum]
MKYQDIVDLYVKIATHHNIPKDQQNVQINNYQQFETSKKKAECWGFDFGFKVCPHNKDYEVFRKPSTMVRKKNEIFKVLCNCEYCNTRLVNVTQEQLDMINNMYSLVAKKHNVNPSFIEKEITRFNDDSRLHSYNDAYNKSQLRFCVCSNEDHIIELIPYSLNNKARREGIDLKDCIFESLKQCSKCSKLETLYETNFKKNINSIPEKSMSKSIKKK